MKFLKLRLLNIHAKWEKSRNKSFLELLEQNPNAKIVDLGCGDGKFTVQIKNRIGAREIYGVEINRKALEEARKRGIKVIEHDLNKFPYPFDDGEFDVVVSNQVIEHLLYPVRFMREVYRILKPGGYAVISTENLASWDNIIALIMGWTPFSMEFDSGLRKIGNPLSPHNKEIDEDYETPHLRILTIKGLVELAEYIGFKVEAVIGSGHLLGRIGEIVDRTHARFVTIKARRPI